MDKLTFTSLSKLGSPELKKFRDGIENEFTKLMLAMSSSGLVIRREANGVLANSFLVTGLGAVEVAEGIFLDNSTGVIKCIKISNTSIALSVSTYPNGTYYVCVKAKTNNYEPGLITLTNGSDTVTIVKGDFKSLRPYGYIIIDAADSQFGNGGEYKIIAGSDISGTSAKLEVPFNGTTESNLKWKIGGEFPSNSVPSATADKLIYQYDSYEILVQKSPTGYVLAEIQITTAIITSNLDRRMNFLASFNSNRANADDIVSGALNNITTIEEKAQANRVDRIVKTIITKGVRSGLVCSITGHTLSITSGEAYDGIGKYIRVPVNITFDLALLLSQSIIVEGDNYLHIFYKSPNNYDWFWSTTPSSLASNVLVAKIIYDSSEEEE